MPENTAKHFTDIMKKIINEYWPLFAVLALLAAMLLFGSCKTTKVVPIIHDTLIINNEVYRDVFKHDSIHVHDSMWIDVKGDTVLIDRWHTKYVEYTKTDSVSIHDTIVSKEEIPIEIEKVVYKTPNIVWVLLGIFALTLFVLIWSFVKKFENFIN